MSATVSYDSARQVRLQNDRLTLLVDLETGRITDWRDSARPEVAHCELGAMGFLHAPMVRLLNAEAEDGPAGILLFGLIAPDVSVHQWIWVQASGAEVEIETRWVNEGYVSATLERPLPVFGEGLEPVAEAQWRRDSLCILGAVSPEFSLHLAPFQTAQRINRVRVAPLGARGFGSSENGWVSIDAEGFSIEVVSPRLDSTVILLDQEEKSLEAKMTLLPSKPTRVAFVGVQAVAVRAAGGELLMSTRESNAPPAPLPTLVPPATVSITPSASLAELAQASERIEIRGAAAILRAAAYLREDELDVAESFFMMAQASIGDCPLVHAFGCRLGTLRNDEDMESLHQMELSDLAPLHPLVKALAFLRLEQSMSKEPNAGLHALAQQPIWLLRVARFLVETGLHTDASRWIDEALRHGSWAELHELYAQLLRKSSPMSAEAAIHEGKATTAPRLS
ncbi:MAG: hypothetical protein JST35_09080 [Armatimonadetes bacterium]|nr:hypothetical protein [Armatimonadota bacterium]